MKFKGCTEWLGIVPEMAMTSKVGPRVLLKTAENFVTICLRTHKDIHEVTELSEIINFGLYILQFFTRLTNDK